MRTSLQAFARIQFFDFEFGGPDGGLPEPRCVVVTEWPTGQTTRVWLEDGAPRLPPYPCDAATLCVAFYASAELSCHLALQWPLPPYVLDLFIEFRRCTNGRELPAGNSLLGALLYFGLDAMDAHEKEDMRTLARRGGPYTTEERSALLDYCESDTRALMALFRMMAPHLNVPQALLHGRSMQAAARIETVGVPLDVPLLSRLQQAWPSLKTHVIHAIDAQYGVFEGTRFSRSFLPILDKGEQFPRVI